MFDAIEFMFDAIEFMFDAIGFMFDVIEFMFDVIVNEVKKYSTNAGKFVEKLDVITIVQVRTDRKKVMHAIGFNLQRFIHIKRGLKHRTSQAKHVKLCRELPSRSQKLPSFARNMSAQDANIN